MAKEIAKASGTKLSEAQIDEISRSSLFQSAVGDLLEKSHRYNHGMASKNISGGTSEKTKAEFAELDVPDGTGERETG